MFGLFVFFLTERLRRAGFAPDVNDEDRLTHQRWKVKDCEKVTVDFLIPPMDDRDRGGKLKHIQSDFGAIVTPGLQLAFIDRQRITLTGRTITGEDASARGMGLRSRSQRSHADDGYRKQT